MACRISVLVFVAGALCSIIIMAHANVPQRPTRPDRFTDKKDVQDFVAKIKDYYAILSRGRYGKRSTFLIPEFVLRPRYVAPLPYEFKYGGRMDFSKKYE